MNLIKIIKKAELSLGISNPDINFIKMLIINVNYKTTIIPFYIKINENFVKFKELNENFIKNLLRKKQRIIIYLNKKDLLNNFYTNNFILYILFNSKYEYEYFEIFVSYNNILNYEEIFIPIVKLNEIRIAELIKLSFSR